MSNFLIAFEVFLFIVAVAITVAVVARCLQCLIPSNKPSEQNVSSEITSVCVISENYVPHDSVCDVCSPGISNQTPQVEVEGSVERSCSRCNRLIQRNIVMDDLPPSYAEVITASAQINSRTVQK